MGLLGPHTHEESPASSPIKVLGKMAKRNLKLLQLFSFVSSDRGLWIPRYSLSKKNKANF